MHWEFIDSPIFESKRNPPLIHNDGEYILVSDFIFTDISYECISILQYYNNLYNSDVERYKQFHIDAPRNTIIVDGKQLNYSQSFYTFLEWLFNGTKHGCNMVTEACTQAILAKPFCLLNDHLMKQECMPLDCTGSRVCIDISTETLDVNVHKTFKIAPLKELSDYQHDNNQDWKNVQMSLSLPCLKGLNADEDNIYLSNIIYS